MVIAYPIKSGLYVNLTNRCPCACEFCLRKNGPGVQGSDSLWLEREPTREEAIAAVDAANPAQYAELVFCGYGEPTERLEDVLAIARHVRETAPAMKIRINTNGLSDLIHGRPTAAELKGLPPVDFPQETAVGALALYVANGGAEGARRYRLDQPEHARSGRVFQGLPPEVRTREPCRAASVREGLRGHRSLRGPHGRRHAGDESGEPGEVP